MKNDPQEAKSSIPTSVSTYTKGGLSVLISDSTHFSSYDQ